MTMPAVLIVDQFVSPANPLSLPIQRMSGPASEKMSVEGWRDFTRAMVSGHW